MRLRAVVSVRIRHLNWASLCLVFWVVLFALTATNPCAAGDDKAAPKPSARDKCPVCGMFVAKYPDWVASLLFRDGTKVFFDGAKDMFKYHLDPAQYGSSKKPSEVAAVNVIDYYSLVPVDGRKACYVIGSDVFGPMGRELVPFEKQSDAEQFLNDHKGKAILRFHEVTKTVLKQLDS